MKKILFLTIPIGGTFAGFYYYGLPKYFQANRKDIEFDVKVDYCLGCGFRQQAEFFSKNVLEIFPKAHFNLIPVEDVPGSLEILVRKKSGEEKMIHSSLGGDGKIYRDNVKSIIQKLENFVL